MGSIIGALIGKHLAHSEEQRQNAHNLILPKIASYIKDPVGSPYEPEEIDDAVEAGIQYRVFNKEHGKILQGQIKRAREMRAAAKALETSQQQTQQKQPMGVPSMNPGQASAFSPGPAPAQPAEFSPMQKSQLIQMALQAQQQGQGGPPSPTQGLAPDQPPGLPKPPIPFGSGAPAGPAPAAQPNPAQMMAVGSQSGGIGMGGPRPALPAPPAEEYHTPWTAGRNAAANVGRRLGEKGAAALRPTLEVKGQVEREQAALDYEALKARYESEPWFQGLTNRQKTEVLSGRNVSPELRPQNIPGLVQGKSLQPGEKDFSGNPIDADGFYRVRVFADGNREYIPEMTTTSGIIEPDANSNTGFSRVVRDRTGREISRSAGATPPPAYVPTTTTNARSSEQAVTVGDQVKVIPIQSSTTTTSTRSVPGMPSPPAGIPSATAPSQRPGPPSASAGQGRVIGESPAAFKMRVENEYTPEGQKVMMELVPRMQMIQRLRAALEPYKNNDVPAGSLLDSILYKLGYAGDQGSFLSQLNLGSIAQAGSLIRGVSRAQQVLGQAMIHTPNAWRDSSKMMYQKLTEILQNMKDMETATNNFAKKYPGLKAPPAAGMTPPPGDESEAQKIERLAKKYGRPQ